MLLNIHLLTIATLASIGLRLRMYQILLTLGTCFSTMAIRTSMIRQMSIIMFVVLEKEKDNKNKRKYITTIKRVKKYT